MDELKLFHFIPIPRFGNLVSFIAYLNFHFYNVIHGRVAQISDLIHGSMKYANNSVKEENPLSQERVRMPLGLSEVRAIWAFEGK